ncbi:hypothetical protein ACJRO7_012864 [Eucalyptus globulus]|uniref:Uncharacterized protein n=1 Tax=Eucalyptus globulus TaxID=34317 RepID=A0ABD3LKY9_EUCGL
MIDMISLAICRLEHLSSFTIADWKGIFGKIPAYLASLPYLWILDLISASQTHPIMDESVLLGHTPSWMNYCNITSGNQIAGLIPATISQIYRLAYLDLSSNRLSSQIPPSLGKMPVLATLNLDYNQISEGPIPDAFGPRSYITVLDLSYNDLRGPIPKSISAAMYIGHMDLSHCHLCRRITVGSSFDHLEASSFQDNHCLYGKPLKACWVNNENLGRCLMGTGNKVGLTKKKKKQGRWSEHKMSVR